MSATDNNQQQSQLSTSVCGIGSRRTGLFKAGLAAFSLPGIPARLGSQQNIIWNANRYSYAFYQLVLLPLTLR